MQSLSAKQLIIFHWLPGRVHKYCGKNVTIFKCMNGGLGTQHRVAWGLHNNRHKYRENDPFD
jgi:hypothetical protein